MPSVLVTYHTRSGNTEKMAHCVVQGARSVEGVDVRQLPVSEVTPDDLLNFDGIIIGSPVYYGTMAAEVKKLIDDSVMHHGRLAGKVGGAFATSGVAGGGSETTVLDILKSLLVHGMIIEGDASGPHYGPVAVGAPEGGPDKHCEKLGARVARLVRKLHG